MPEAEQRDSLQQRVDRLLESDLTTERSTLIHHVTGKISTWLWTLTESDHRVYDEILASSFVKTRLSQCRHRDKPTRGDITERESQNGGQLALPGLPELYRWRWASRDGKVEKSVAHSVIGELYALDADYEARQIDMAAKRRYISAITTKWEASTAVAEETVEQFYQRMGWTA